MTEGIRIIEQNVNILKVCRLLTRNLAVKCVNFYNFQSGNSI